MRFNESRSSSESSLKFGKSFEDISSWSKRKFAKTYQISDFSIKIEFSARICPISAIKGRAGGERNASWPARLDDTQ